MDLNKFIEGVKQHAGTIGAVLASVGVIGTAVLSSRAAIKCSNEIDPEMEDSEKIKKYIINYIPTGLCAAATIGCIIGSDRAHVARETALVGVAAMWKRQYVNLDKAVISESGSSEEALDMHKKAAEMAMKDHPNKFDRELSINEILVYEPYTDVYFITTREAIAWALLKANEKLAKEYDVKLSYIIRLLGGEVKPEANEIGWNWENETQEYAWSYYGGPWIDMVPSVTKNGAFCLFYTVDPESQNPEDMIYYNQ